MIPPNIREKGDILKAAIECGTIRPRRLKTRDHSLVVDINPRWRLVSVGGTKPWEIMSHERYNRFCSHSRNHVKGGRPVRNFPTK